MAVLRAVAVLGLGCARAADVRQLAAMEEQGLSPPTRVLPTGPIQIPPQPQPKPRPTLVLKGERHTGTHFLAQILHTNFPAEHQHLHVEQTVPGERCNAAQAFAHSNETMCCWTSGKADDRCRFSPQPTTFVFVVRHPYPWLLSMSKKPFEYDQDVSKMSISKFIRWPFTQFALEGIGRYKNPIDMYNQKVGSYLRMRQHHTIFIRHEDLFDLHTLNRVLLMPLVKRGFKLKDHHTSLKWPDFASPQQNDVANYMFGTGDFAGAQAYAADLRLSTQWFTRPDLHFIKHSVDPVIMKALNYTLENVSGVPTQGVATLETQLPASAPQTLAKPLPTLVLKGERHTGTHWLAHVLRHNFDSSKQHLHVAPTLPAENCPWPQPFDHSNQTMCCWTSGKADDRCVYDPTPTAYIFLVRHPYPWLLSMKAHPAPSKCRPLAGQG